MSDSPIYDDKTIFKVILNEEEQYSIWPVKKENAPGWRDAGKTGTQKECLAYINEVWTDMRPLSLRKKPEDTEKPRGQIDPKPKTADAADNTIYKVIVDEEGQYNIWPTDREGPLGWNDAGKTGTKQECIDYIKEVWTDMRPLSLRKKMEEMKKQRG